MTCGDDWLDVALGEHACGGDGDDEVCGLCVLGELELVFGTLEDELRDGEAESFVGLVEGGASDGEVGVEIAAHSDGLGILAGKEEGWLCHRNYRNRDDATADCADQCG